LINVRNNKITARALYALLGNNDCRVSIPQQAKFATLIACQQMLLM